MKATRRFWLFAILSLLWAGLLVQALFPPDGAKTELLHLGTVFWVVVQGALLWLAYRAWQDWR
ncbi:hypothetical protein BDZ31_001789 [Conexibacter arvalis]|uniref:Uncharacterized protein n=1 Tax=Conexibacter arvalis TaxID=912552 RepID=A0A840ID99_9ACTN|nr:hypothetical protein [Conexibacter arvalis]